MVDLFDLATIHWYFFGRQNSKLVLAKQKIKHVRRHTSRDNTNPVIGLRFNLEEFDCLVKGYTVMIQTRASLEMENSLFCWIAARIKLSPHIRRR